MHVITNNYNTITTRTRTICLRVRCRMPPLSARQNALCARDAVLFQSVRHIYEKGEISLIC